MGSFHKLCLASVVLTAAVCAALPFQRHLMKQNIRRNQSTSRLRWRDTRASVPAPLRAAGTESGTEELHAELGTQPRVEPRETTNHASHAVTLRDPSQPPRIPAVYRPLIPAPTEYDQSPQGLKGSETELPRPVSPSSSAVPSNEKQPETGFKVIRHRIRDGDTLQALAGRYLGDPDRYREIYESNKHRLPSTEVLPLNLMIEIYVPR